MPETYKRFNSGKTKLSSIEINRLMLVLEYATKRPNNSCKENPIIDDIINKINSLTDTSIELNEEAEIVENKKDETIRALSLDKIKDLKFTEDYDIDDFLEYMPQVFNAETVMVFLMGAKKYGKNNYMTCRPEELYSFIDSAFRHLAKMMDEEYIDSESNLHHAAHVAANMAMIMAIQEKYTNGENNE